MTRCTCKTLKGDQCKKDALAGKTMCSIHAKKCASATAASKVPAKKVIKKSPVRKAPKVATKKAPVKKVTKKAPVKKVAKVLILPESATLYEKLLKVGKIDAVKKRVYEQMLKSTFIDDVEFDKSGHIDFVINKYYGSGDEDELELAHNELAKILKGVPHTLSEEYDEERLRWNMRLTILKVLAKKSPAKKTKKKAQIKKKASQKKQQLPKN